VNAYRGISYPIPSFLQRGWLYRIWRGLMCPRGFHLLDESWASYREHYLSCDACDMEIRIASIREYVEK
jgi:hypothetical protein